MPNNLHAWLIPLRSITSVFSASIVAVWTPSGSWKLSLKSGQFQMVPMNACNIWVAAVTGMSNIVKAFSMGPGDFHATSRQSNNGISVNTTRACQLLLTKPIMSIRMPISAGVSFIFLKKSVKGRRRENLKFVEGHAFKQWVQSRHSRLSGILTGLIFEVQEWPVSL